MQNPQTLEDAIKGAQIYDDLSDKKGLIKTDWSNKPSSFKPTGNYNGKR